MTPQIQKLNRLELETVVYEELSKMAEKIQYGTIGVNLTLHNSQIQKVEFTETRKSRFSGVENETVQ